MLSQLVHLLSKDKVYLESTLANHLGVNEEMAGQLLHELIRQGYVENIISALVSHSCNNCGSHCNSADLAKNRNAIWSLTEKGRELAGRN